MTDFSSPQICSKPYESRPRSVTKPSLLPTLKPEDPKNYYAQLFVQRDIVVECPSSCCRRRMPIVHLRDRDMDPISSPTSEARRDQMFPVLSEAELARLRRFGNVQSYAPGASVLRAGDVAPGLQVVLSGKVLVTPHEADLRSRPIVTHGPGEFIGELAQLSGVPALVDATATAEVSALVIPSPRLRDLMVEEAELGERIMRALILRRVGLLDTGAGGPVIVGDADNADVLRLEGFLARNAHPRRLFAPSGKARRWWRRCMDIWRGAGVVRWGWRFRGGCD